MLSTGGDFLLYAFAEILNPIRSADNIFRACSAVKFRDGLRISAETRVEASKPRAVRMSTSRRRPTEAGPKPSPNDDQLLKEKIHDLQEALEEKDRSLEQSTQVEELRDALDREKNRNRELTIKKEVAWMVVDSLAKGAASMA